MPKTRLNSLSVTIAFLLLAAFLWTLRSWNLEIGDGEFCCKQTVGEQAFAVTLSRSFLSYLLYRAMFFTLHPLIGWWVEDLIALSSCAAGLVFFYALYRLAIVFSKTKTDFWLFLLFPSTTLTLQIFCGHIEFYPWTCAFLMLCAWWSWESLYRDRSYIWASSAMMFSAAFHSSGVFYFPVLLLLPILKNKTDEERQKYTRREIIEALIAFAVFLAAALFHRKPTHWLYFFVFAAGCIWYFSVCPKAWKTTLASWAAILIPWLSFFALRAVLGLRAEPLLEHLPPLGEPYDHGAYLYEAFSWDHLYDKTMFHLWLMPFGLLALLGFAGFAWRRIHASRWSIFVLHFCLWAMIWSILFYPQLRTRDWDLFASVSIPLNLFAVCAALILFRPALFRTLTAAAIVIQLYISAPIILKNSSLLVGRGYVELEYAPKPVSTHAYIRGLEIGVTPLTLKNVRSGPANVRIVPLERGYQSWSEDLVLERGKTYRFEPELTAINNKVPVQDEESETR